MVLTEVSSDPACYEVPLSSMASAMHLGHGNPWWVWVFLCLEDSGFPPRSCHLHGMLLGTLRPLSKTYSYLLASSQRHTLEPPCGMSSKPETLGKQMPEEGKVGKGNPIDWFHPSSESAPQSDFTHQAEWLQQKPCLSFCRREGPIDATRPNHKSGYSVAEKKRRLDVHLPWKSTLLLKE